MDINVQTSSHLGLRAWFELLRTSREGLMPKYLVKQKYDCIRCSYPNCRALSIQALEATRWERRQCDGGGYLCAFRHSKLCPWRNRVGVNSQNSFTTEPLERAYVYWAQLEHKLNHK